MVKRKQIKAAGNGENVKMASELLLYDMEMVVGNVSLV